ncbi:S41 family peptidase [Sphingorhabdus sp.]|jgi:carboxyl-terminal processing protease|uniref:S41 family peptidase n=1 Tax=Sphingorhabdus sp. TaxID=1902408 RepID=UPI0037C94252
MRIFVLLLALLASAFPAQAEAPNKWREDALAFPEVINAQYAYLDRLAGGRYQLTPKLQAEAESVKDDDSLLTFAERALFLLADHHAITDASFEQSWALVPSYSDIWIERKDGRYIATSVRQQSPAELGGFKTGATLITVGGQPISDAVDAFWADLGVKQITDDQAGYAARILAAGRRDRPREIVAQNVGEKSRNFVLPSLYTITRDTAPLRLFFDGKTATIKFNDSLGGSDTIAAFDEAMAQLRPEQQLVIDLRDTASGGNTTVARAIMGWFVQKPTSYQIHRSPAEEKQTGIARQWVEQVLPRATKYHKGKVTVLVGRWTGSMGEGLAIGMHSIGADVRGDRMAHLLGATDDLTLPNTGFVFKLPTERLYSVDGSPRERFVPKSGL